MWVLITHISYQEVQWQLLSSISWKERSFCPEFSEVVFFPNWMTVCFAVVEYWPDSSSCRISCWKCGLRQRNLGGWSWLWCPRQWKLPLSTQVRHEKRSEHKDISFWHNLQLVFFHQQVNVLQSNYKNHSFLLSCTSPQQGKSAWWDKGYMYLCRRPTFACIIS